MKSTWIIQELFNGEWYDDIDQPKYSTAGEELALQWMAFEKASSPKHYERNQHRLIRRDETVVSMENVQGHAPTGDTNNQTNTEQ